MTEKAFTLRLKGGHEATIKALGEDIVKQPEIHGALATVTARATRGGKGLGVRNNSLSAQTSGALSVVTSTLHHPRTSGRKWGTYQEKVVKGIVARKAFAKALNDIAARWAAAANAAVGG